jgi:hypothetical protein
VRWQPRDLFAARDLAAEAAIESRWRQIHVRALHQTWGIALGMHAATSDAGDLLLVGPGLAFDACQGELVLDHPLLIAPPKPPPGISGPAWVFDLVVRLDRGAPAWRWVYAGPSAGADAGPPLLAGDMHLGVDVPVARVVLSGAGTIGRVDPTLRRGTRKIAPRMASGRVPVGAPLHPGGTVRVWRCTIDLSRGRFRRPPIVFASLEAYPFQVALFVQGMLEHLLGPFVEIGSPTTTAVTVGVVLGMSPSAFVILPTTQISSVPVAIRWLALEPPDLTEPRIVLARARTREGQTIPNLAAKFTRLLAFPPPGGVSLS